MTPPIDWDNEPVGMVAERAARRAIEAISRTGGLSDEVRDLRDEIAALRSSQRALEAAVAMMAEALFGDGS